MRDDQIPFCRCHKNQRIHPQVLESEMSELPTNPKKLKGEDEQEDEEANVSCREEQEEVLVALVEHRSNEIERLNHHISNYQTKVFLSSKF